jgi:alkylation response protein AidB-like acyl-CoA dehydrogenase
MYVFSEEQELLRKTVGEVGRTQLAPPNGRALAEDTATAVAWSLLHELGWTTIMIPAADGGSGGSLVDACILAEGLAATLSSVPFAAPCIVVPAALQAMTEADADEVREALVSGSNVSVALSAALDIPAVGPSVAWEWVPGAKLVTIGGQGVVPSSVPVVALPSTDVLRPMGRLREPVAEAAFVDDAIVRRLRAFARVALAATLTGTAAGAFATALAHAEQREQFGRPIGSFQAVQHLLADMHVAVESSRSVTYAAAWTMENVDLAGATHTSASAFVWSARSALKVCEGAIQVLGGIGVTEESVAHLYLRSAHVMARMFGGEVASLDAIAGPLLNHTD